MEINDLVNFQKHLKYEIDEQEVVVGFICASLDKTSYQYGFNIQIFNHEFYDNNQDMVNTDILDFYKEIGEYLSPQKQSKLFKLLAQQ